MQEAMAEIKSKSSEKDWRDLAAAAASEADPEKLGRIIKELCAVLDKSQARKQPQAAPPVKKSA